MVVPPTGTLVRIMVSPTPEVLDIRTVQTAVVVEALTAAVQAACVPPAYSVVPVGER